ncbi:MAG: uracil-DNA glycosylase [Anaerolineales bacterium]|nr:uracil-DNA glycosylase [Anaerolineales bacterium]
MGAATKLETIAQEIAICTDCKLHASRKKVVPGEGPADSVLMFIGEGPGFHENEQGRPFVGAAGRFLEDLLSSIDLKREDVFIGNVVKCRPPANRDPQPEEIQACGNYLERQIVAIDPKVIVTLGRFSMARYFPGARISKIHGQAKEINGRLIVPMYHPAAALHQPSLRKVIEADFSMLPALIGNGAPPSQPDQPTPVDPEQLELF